jgi:hypothetical protein
VIDFTSYIAERTRDFTGREWVLAEIDHWLANPDAPRYFVLTGEPGIGKTAFAARLIQIHDLAAFHFCIARRADTIDPLKFVRALSQQLTRFDDFALGILKDSNVSIQARQNIQANYGETINVRIENVIINAPSAMFAFIHTVVDPLKALYSNGFNRQLVILVDALDEAAQYPGSEKIPDLLANVGEMPQKVRFVLTARPEHAALRQFDGQAVHFLRLDAEQDENRRDVHAFIDRQLADTVAFQHQVKARNRSPASAIADIAAASQHNFLYLVWLLRAIAKDTQWLLRAIAKDTQSLDQLQSLPVGLDAIYGQFLRTRTVGKDVDVWRNRYRPLLGVLSAAQAPLTAEQLVQFAQQDAQAIADCVLDVQEFLDPSGTGQSRYQLYHQSLADFLGNQDQAKEFWIDLTAIHRQIAMYYLRRYDDRWTECDAYGLRYLLIHLVKAKEWDRLQRVLDGGTYGKEKLCYDPSTLLYAQDLDLGRQAAARPSLSNEEALTLLPNLWRYSLLRCSLTSGADSYAGTVFEALAALGRQREAIDLAEVLTEQSNRAKVLAWIAVRLAAREGLSADVQNLLVRAREVAHAAKELGADKGGALNTVAVALAHVGWIDEALTVARQVEPASASVNKAPYGRTLRTSALSSGTGSLPA